MGSEAGVGVVGDADARMIGRILDSMPLRVVSREVISSSYCMIYEI